MMSAISIIAVAAFLFCAAILAILVAGIRSDDHAKNLTHAPRTRTEQVTRRLLGVGVRGHAAAGSGTATSLFSHESDRP